MDIEEEAKRIYNDWTHLDGWKPWVDGGNSLRQDAARAEARRQHPLLPAPEWEPWQQRVIDEQQALDGKIRALDKFLFGGTQADAISHTDYNLLVKQLKHMNRYSVVLHARITRFNLASA